MNDDKVVEACMHLRRHSLEKAALVVAPRQ